MTEFTQRELAQIGKHLEKVNEIYDQNIDSHDVRLDIPDKIELSRVSHGMPLGTIEWSDELEEFVFISNEEKPEPVRDTSHIPLPPWPHT